MKTIRADDAMLLVIDVQARLMPVITEADTVTANIGRLLRAAAGLDVPVIVTEQNPAGLGPTVAMPGLPDRTPFAKMAFDCTREPGFDDLLPDGPADLVVAGCEAHVCVLQTVLGLLDGGRRVFVVADAIGSRVPANRDRAIERMARHGAEIVTTEMVVFEWLGTARHPRFRETVALVK